MNCPEWLAVLQEVVGLVGAEADLSVAVPLHGAGVDVGRASQHVLVVYYHQLRGEQGLFLMFHMKRPYFFREKILFLMTFFSYNFCANPSIEKLLPGIESRTVDPAPHWICINRRLWVWIKYGSESRC